MIQQNGVYIVAEICEHPKSIHISCNCTEFSMLHEIEGDWLNRIFNELTNVLV